MHSQKRDYVS